MQNIKKGVFIVFALILITFTIAVYDPCFDGSPPRSYSSLDFVGEPVLSFNVIRAGEGEVQNPTLVPNSEDKTTIYGVLAETKLLQSEEISREVLK